MSELIKREDVQREIQASFDGGAFRWQDGQDLMDRINALPTASPWHRVEEPPKEEGAYFVAVFFSGHWIFDAAWFTHDITEIYCVPCEKKISGFYRGNHEVHPDYWMPIEPPKEENNGSSRKEASSDL